MSTPVVPPRPTARQAPPTEIELPQEQPIVPPRPNPKHLDRGVSPSGRPFTQSPFNEKFDPLSLTKTKSREPIQKRPSVSALPGLGSEGSEYGEIQYQPVQPVSALAADAAHQSRNIADDLKLHAPKPSLPKTAAAAQVQPITRTDSTVAAAHGIGRSPSQDGEALGRVISRASISRPESASSDRRKSVWDEGPADHGGFRVPINPLLGDVQAPSPAPVGISPHHTGHSTHDGRPRRHNRTKSGREVFFPSDSYGLHGHGVQPSGDLERDWYSKHPGELKQEEVAGHGVYESIYSGRGAFALSSDDLNKIVRNTVSRGSGFGTSGNVPSYPDEQIGYEASEQYTRRRTPSIHKVGSNQQPPESPLRKASFPATNAPPAELRHGSASQESTSDVEEVHIGAPAKKFNKVTGGEQTMKETEDVKPYASHPTQQHGLINEHGYTVPILADDEVAKEVGHENLHPAISPAPRRDSAYDDEYRTSPLNSRPSSRPGSIYGLHSAAHHALQRYTSHDDREHMHTPLEDVDEYEPLFPEDDERKMMSTAERFKRRPDTLRHKFPSQDVWEDTPDFAMHQATVSTPDLPSTENRALAENSTSAFELPEVEQARKGEVSEEEKKKLIPAGERLAKSRFAPHLRDDMPTRPGIQNRFPSQDIWEDSPESQYLVTEVSAPEDQPLVPHRPEESRLGEGASSQQIEPSVAPSIPARPQKQVHAVPPADAKLTDTTIPPPQTELKKVPSIPDRPKPQVPARPPKKDAEELSKVTSASSQGSAEAVVSPPMPKAKPQVPARPPGIAGLKANFMNDLNQKLGLGPPKEKEKEVEPEPEEAKPLEDARKGRARGPQRRAPAKSPAAPVKQSSELSLSKPQSIWHIDDSGVLNMAASKMSENKIAQMEQSTIADAPMAPTIDTTTKADIEAEERADDAPMPLASALSTNTAGESTDPTAVGDSSTLSKHSTAESTASQGLEREDINASADAIPVSKQTTASTSSGDALERVESVDPATRTEGAANEMAGAFPE